MSVKKKKNLSLYYVLEVKFEEILNFVRTRRRVGRCCWPGWLWSLELLGTDAVLWLVAASQPRQTNADLIKLLLVVRTGESVEVCVGMGYNNFLFLI